MSAGVWPVCVVDDDCSAREAVVGLLRSAGLTVEAFGTAREFLDRLRLGRPPGCLVLDVDLPGLTGLELQQELASANIDVPIIFVTGYGDIPMSVRAIKAGALDFFTKPFEPEDLLDAVRRGIERSQSRQPQAVAEATNGSANGASLPSRSRTSSSPSAPSSSTRRPARFGGIVGDAPVIRTVLDQVETVARTNATVLIYGETGTGKELIARAVHDHSDHKNGPFVKVNCAAIPSGLLESELMGHEKGAFTGAIARRLGRFELAKDGTIFLDEIGEIAIDLQPKLLRLLQEREFERVGGSQTLKSNARLVAATNRDLRAMVDERTFREDLYYRLSVFPIQLPPLRDRREDIPSLVEHFVREISARMNTPLPPIPPDVLETLSRHDWPGNIRELQNVLERAVILAAGNPLQVALPQTASISIKPSASREFDFAAVSRAHIVSVLEATNWVIAGPDGAAARLGLNRSTLNFRMKKLGITRPKRG